MPRRRRLAAALRVLAENLSSSIIDQVLAAVSAKRRRHEIVLAELRGHLHRLEQRLARLAAPGRERRPARPCKVPGCGRVHVAFGYCKNHYQQWRYRERRIAEAKAQGRKYRPRRAGEKRAGRPALVPLPV